MQQTRGARKGLFTLGPLHNRLYPLPDQCAMQHFSRSRSTKLPCHVLQARIFTMPYGKNKKLSQRKFRQQQFRARLHHNRPTGVVMTPLVGNHTQFRQDDTAENVMFQWLKLRISTGRAFWLPLMLMRNHLETEFTIDRLNSTSTVLLLHFSCVLGFLVLVDT